MRCPRPCVYFTALREPMERLVSEYDYFCVKVRQGCPLSVSPP